VLELELSKKPAAKQNSIMDMFARKAKKAPAPKKPAAAGAGAGAAPSGGQRGPDPEPGGTF
jgi:hypothetical protein